MTFSVYYFRNKSNFPFDYMNINTTEVEKMAKFCGTCGASLSDEMIFCNKCGARYREGAPAQTETPVQPMNNSAVVAKPKAKINVVWYVAIILAIVSVVLFAAAPIVEISADGITESHSVFYFFENDTVQSKAENAGVDGDLDTAKIVAFAAIGAGALGIVMLIVAMLSKGGLGFVGVVAQAILMAGGALLVFVMLKGPINDIVTTDVSFGLTTFGWIYLCAGSFSIVTAIKAIQSKKA